MQHPELTLVSWFNLTFPCRVVFNEVIQTSKQYMRDITVVCHWVECRLALPSRLQADTDLVAIATCTSMFVRGSVWCCSDSTSLSPAD